MECRQLRRKYLKICTKQDEHKLQLSLQQLCIHDEFYDIYKEKVDGKDSVEGEKKINCTRKISKNGPALQEDQAKIKQCMNIVAYELDISHMP